MDTIPVKQLNTSDGSNRFRFQSFRHRVKNVKINVAHRILRDLEEPEEGKSFFEEALASWRELNCTAHFALFLKEVGNYAHSLVQLLYHKETVVNLIIKHLQVPNSLAYEPLLNLVTVLARDLQDEFVPFFPQVFRATISLLPQADVKLLECVFNAIAYLFKYLGKDLVRNVCQTYDLLVSQLQDNKPFIRAFAAEVFGFLSRKVSRKEDVRQLHMHIVNSLRENPSANYAEGLAIMFFENVKQVNGNLHSRAKSTLESLIDVVLRTEDDQNDIAFIMLQKVFILVAHHSEKEHLATVWSLLTEQTVHALGQETKNLTILGKILVLINICACVHKKSVFKLAEDVAGLIFTKNSTVVGNEKNREYVRKQFVKLFSSLMLTSSLEGVLVYGKKSIDVLFASEEHTDVIALCTILQNRQWQHMPRIILPPFLKYVQSHWARDPHGFVFFLSQLFDPKSLPETIASLPHYLKTTQGLIRLETVAKGHKAQSSSTLPVTSVPQEIFGMIRTEQEKLLQLSSELNVAGSSKQAELITDIVNAAGLISAACSCVAALSIPFEEVCQMLTELIQTLSQSFSSLAAGARGSPELQKTAFVIGAVGGKCLGVASRRSQAFAVGVKAQQPQQLSSEKKGKEDPLMGVVKHLLQMWDSVESLTRSAGQNAVLLQGVADYIEVLRDLSQPMDASGNLTASHSFPSGKTLESAFSEESFKAIMPFLKENVNSFYPSVRLQTLRILAALDQMMSTISPMVTDDTADQQRTPKKTAQGKGQGQQRTSCKVFQLCLEMEQTEETIATLREKTILLRRLVSNVSTGIIPRHPLYDEVPVRYVLGVLSTNFAPLAAEASKTLASLVTSGVSGYEEVVWRVYREAFGTVVRSGTTTACEEMRTVLADLELVLTSYSASDMMVDEVDASNEEDKVQSQPTKTKGKKGGKNRKKLAGGDSELSAVDTAASELSAYTNFTFRDSNIAKIDASVAMAYGFCGESGASESRLVGMFVQGILSTYNSRFDLSNYGVLLIKTLEQIPQITEKRSADIVPVFMELYRTRFLTMDSQEATTTEEEKKDKEAPKVDSGVEAAPKVALQEDRSGIRKKILNFLSVFAGVNNPDRLHSRDELYSICMDLLCNGDTEFQKRALDCILGRWKATAAKDKNAKRAKSRSGDDSTADATRVGAGPVGYEDQLRALVDDQKFRDSLSTLDIEQVRVEISSKGDAAAIANPSDTGSPSPVVTKNQSAWMEFIKVLTRILYGKIISRRGRNSMTRSGLKARRTAVFAFLVRSGFTDAERWCFVELMLQPFAAILRLPSSCRASKEDQDGADVEMGLDGTDGDAAFVLQDDAEVESLLASTLKKQLGYLNVLEDLVKQWKKLVEPFMSKLLKVLLYVIRNSEAQLNHARRIALEGSQMDVDRTTPDEEDEATKENEGEGEEEDVGEVPSSSSPEMEHLGQLRSIRQQSLRRLREIFEVDLAGFQFTPYMQPMFDVFVIPRLDGFDRENTQAPSALVELMATWSKNPRYVGYLVEYSSELMPKLFGILSAKKVRESVVSVVLGIVESVLDIERAEHEAAMEIDEQDEQDSESSLEPSSKRGVVDYLLVPYMSCLLQNLKNVLSKLIQDAKESAQALKLQRDNIPTRIIKILARVSSHVTVDPEQGEVLAEMMLPFLKKPNKQVPEPNKAEILHILANLVPVLPSLKRHGLLPSVSSSSFEKQDDSTNALPSLSPYYSIASQLFSQLRTREARDELLGVFAAFAELDDRLKIVSDLVHDLNAYSKTRLDEHDFERKFSALSQITGELGTQQLSAEQWLPILHNLIYYMQDVEEYSVRTNATFGVVTLMERVAKEEAAKTSQGHTDADYKSGRRGLQLLDLVLFTIFPAVKRGMKLNESAARQEFVSVLGAMVRLFPELPQFKDMVPLLAGGDDEASFFSNIHHVQMHRRLRALRRLAAECGEGSPDAGTLEDNDMMGDDEEEGEEKPEETEQLPQQQSSSPKATLSPSNIANIFVPLVSHMIFESDRVAEHQLVTEAINAVAACAKALPWGHYYALLRRFLNAIPKKPQLEKALIRVVVAVLERFHFNMVAAPKSDEKEQVQDKDGMVPDKSANVEKPEGKKVEDDRVPDEMIVDEGDADDKTKSPETAPKEDEDDNDDDDDDDDDEEAADVSVVDKLDEAARDLLVAYRVHDAVMGRLLPELHRLLAKRDEEENVTIRVPIALAITKLLKQLPKQSMDLQLPKLLLTLCHLLRSRLQDTRDSTRDTLIKVSLLLGPAYLSPIVKELEGALTRGYQLHVLGYTIHALLVALIPTLETNLPEVDACIRPLVRIFVNDIFGETGEEREVEELKGKLKEMKTSKSFDSFELVAKIIGFRCVSLLLLPLKEILLETTSLKVTRKVDEIFRRIALGLNVNSNVQLADFMVFIHELITENLPLSQLDGDKQQGKKGKTFSDKLMTVQLKRSDALAPVKHFHANAHRFIEFGLSLLLTALKRERLNLKDVEHLGMVDPMVEIIGKSLYSKHPSVAVLAIRILTIIVKSPLPAIQTALPVVIKRLFEIIARSPSTTSELVQQTFRLLTVIIRECPGVQIKDQQLITLLEVIRPDLEEPERQTTTFSLIRAILSRKFIVNEVYDLMDEIKKVMITSQSVQARELCRSAYCQFLMEYPHADQRLRKQVNFLVKNLNYEYESGRESVLEMIHMCITKFPDKEFFEFSEMLFLALVMSLVNDESSKCREMSGVLLKAVFGRLDLDRAEKLLMLVDKWFEQTDQVQLQRTSSQVYGLVVDAFGERARKWLPTLLKYLGASLELVKDEMVENAKGIEEEETNSNGDLPRWESGYYALNTFSKVVQKITSAAAHPQASPIWTNISHLLLHPHMWIRGICSRLLGVLFSMTNPATLKCTGGNSIHTLFSSRATSLTELAHRICVQMKSSMLSQDLAKQNVKNLFFLGKCMYELKPSKDEEENQSNGASKVEELDEMDEEKEMNAPEGEEEREEVDEEADDEEDADDNDEGDQDGAGSSEQVNGDVEDDVEAGSSSSTSSPLFRLFGKLSYMARVAASRNQGALLRTSVFQWFAAMSTHIPGPELQPYLVPMISILYRTVKDETAKGSDAEELRTLGMEVMDLLQKRVGTAGYLKVYNQVHFKVIEVRRDRKQKRAVMAVADPRASAKRKLQKNEMKRNRKKRKVQELTSKKIRMSNNKKARS
ncbi:U3 snoRNP protein [Quaeritorhiza haematococci]|nr:U3 snoRNP protein [Quaeritorhiza haematococci]